MKAIQFQVSGRWGHFRKAETNNNPLTHDFITKTALVGLMGAVIGVERERMRSFFPMMCDGLLYSVQVLSKVQKQSWGFTFRQASDVFIHAPRYMEVLCQPKFSIIIGCREDLDSVGKAFFEQFCHSIKNSKACFTPVLGLHNCPAELIFQSEGEVHFIESGDFETSGFISKNHKLTLGSLGRLGFDNIPTFQTDDFWNLPERYQAVVFPSPTESVPNPVLKVNGEHFSYSSSEGASHWYMT